MADTPSPTVTLDDIRAASERIAPRVRRTPLLRLPLEDPVYAKAESLQLTGSFKLRGAFNFLASMTPEERAGGVVAHSSGNHAQGVAYAARHFGVPAVIVIPRGAPDLKVERTRELGAEVIRCDDSKAERARVAGELAATRGLTLVPPYDHPWIVAGQGTVGLEIAADLPSVANALVCVGGGGLLSGVATALRALRPEIRLIGVEPALAADAGDSFREGRIVTWPADEVVRTVADGVRTQSVGEITFPIIRANVDSFTAVDEDEILAAAAWYLQRARLVVEPTGALTLAAYRALRAVEGTLAPGPTALVISGGNGDPALLARLMTEPI
jgi:threonine dehydratase